MATNVANYSALTMETFLFNCSVDVFMMMIKRTYRKDKSAYGQKVLV